MNPIGILCGKGIEMQIIELMVESEGDKDVGIFPTSNRVTVILHDAEIDNNCYEEIKSFFADFFDGTCTTFEEAMKAYIVESIREEELLKEMKEDDTRL
jgi:hypothetical protein